jgi:tetratricopeptide (TPR) repeat protein
VGFDRAATLRQAEKLLSQGKLDAAIAAYASVVEHQPTDWNTANTLGDLYVRVGQAERAADQFTRSADRLIAEGFLAKAGAVYKKVLKLKPDDERVLLQAGELAARQGLYGDARAYLTAAADRRTARGDTGGAADIRIRADTLDPNDYERRQAAARLRAERGDIAGAVRGLREIAQALGHKGRPADALAALEHAAQLVPDDDQVRTQLVHAAVEAGDFARARASATTVEELGTLADALDKHGRPDDAIETLRLVARLSPGNVDLALRLARTFLARGDVTAAAEFLSPEVAHADPPLVLSAAELQLRTGRVDAGLLSVRRFLDEEPDGREQVALLSCRLADDAPDAGFRALEIATDAADARSQWGWSVAALQEFSRRTPTYVPALLRLVESCVDGGLEPALYDAQVRLTDAYLEAGAGAEARTLAEDLVDREPLETAHVDRLRRALALLDERDPDGVIAARLSAPAVPGDDAAMAATSIAADDEPELIVVDVESAVDPRAVDLDDGNGEIDLGEIASARALAATRLDMADMDLGSATDDIAAPITAPDLDGVFEQLRDEVIMRSAIAAAEADYQRALVLQRAGDIDECVPLLQSAAREPDVRFAAASLLGRIFKQGGLTSDAIEWLEQAAEASAPEPSAAHEVLYELADALESAGEPARALAVWLELQADAGVYRDVAARIDRLTNLKARG